jgi:ribosomal protein S18 acetylase RimI-like enzyme
LHHNDSITLFRKGEKKDIPEVADLISLAFSHVVGEFALLVEEDYAVRDIVEDLLNTNQNYARAEYALVAETDGHMSGMVFAFPAKRLKYVVQSKLDSACEVFFNASLGDEDTFFIHSFAVKEEFQKRGIGKSLLTLLKTVAREKGFNKIIVATSESNPASHRAYESQGFRVTSSELMMGIDILECDLPKGTAKPAVIESASVAN